MQDNMTVKSDLFKKNKKCFPLDLSNYRKKPVYEKNYSESDKIDYKVEEIVSISTAQDSFANSSLRRFDSLHKENSVNEFPQMDEFINLIDANHYTEDLKAGDYIYNDSIRIVKRIGKGAQATVYLGMIDDISQFVAVKRYCLPSTEIELCEKINEEFENFKESKHPNVIKYFDIDTQKIEDTLIIDIIMEYIDGVNLKEYASLQGNRLSKEKTKLIARKLLEGIEYLHNQSIIHRDIKPQNVLVNEDLSEVKLADFGISVKIENSESFKQRSMIGTPWYMAPEVILEKPYAYEVDIWSLGCIIYEMVSGSMPYSDMNRYNAMMKMAQYASPLEYANEEIQDIFYDKQNRDILDFLQKCWRPNNIFRPKAVELLEHKYLQ